MALTLKSILIKNLSLFEQLHLFLDQLSHSSVEFTACDIFTLNIRLIISVSLISMLLIVIIIYKFKKKSIQLVILFYILFCCCFKTFAAGLTYLVILIQYQTNMKV